MLFKLIIISVLILQMTLGDTNNSTKNGFIEVKVGLKDNYHLKVGDRVRLECEFNSNAKLDKIYWLKNLEELIQPKKNRIFITKRNFSTVLILKRINIFDKGSYSCYAENEFGIAESETSIFVQDDDIQIYSNNNRNRQKVKAKEDYLSELNDLIEPDNEPPTLNPTIIESNDPSESIRGYCEPYRGSICSSVFYGTNNSIYSINDKQQIEIENKLKHIMPLIQTIPQSKPQCSQFILSSLCLFAFPLCDSSSSSSFDVHLISRPKQICRSDCVKLQYDICLNEYLSIKSLFSTQNTKDNLMLECNQLPPSSDIQSQCVPVIKMTVDRLNPRIEEETPMIKDTQCIIGNGADYSGRQSYSQFGRKCLNWDSGHNYCRNLNNDIEPWCFVRNNGIIQKEYCGLAKCLSILPPQSPIQPSTHNTMSISSLLYIIIPSICVPLAVLTIYLIIRICKTTSDKQGTSSTFPKPPHMPNYYQTQSKYSLNSLASKSARSSSSDYSDFEQRRLAAYTKANSTKTSTLLSSSTQSQQLQQKRVPICDTETVYSNYYEAPKSIYDMVK